MVYLVACLVAMLAELLAAVALSTRVKDKRTSVKNLRNIVETLCDRSQAPLTLKRRKRGAAASLSKPERAR